MVTMEIKIYQHQSFVKKIFVVKRKNVSKICVDIPRVQKVGNCPTANFHLMVWTSSS